MFLARIPPAASLFARLGLGTLACSLETWIAFVA
jgi:hypothetical protein